MTERTISIPDETDADVQSVLGDRSFDDFAAEALREQVRRDRVAERLRAAIDEGRASGDPVPLTGDQLRTRLRSQRAGRGEADRA